MSHSGYQSASLPQVVLLRNLSAAYLVISVAFRSKVHKLPDRLLLLGGYFLMRKNHNIPDFK